MLWVYWQNLIPYTFCLLAHDSPSRRQRATNFARHASQEGAQVWVCSFHILSFHAGCYQLTSYDLDPIFYSFRFSGSFGSLSLWVHGCYIQVFFARSLQVQWSWKNPRRSERVTAWTTWRLCHLWFTRLIPKLRWVHRKLKMLKLKPIPSKHLGRKIVCLRFLSLRFLSLRVPSLPSPSLQENLRSRPLIALQDVERCLDWKKQVDETSIDQYNIVQN